MINSYQVCRTGLVGYMEMFCIEYIPGHYPGYIVNAKAYNPIASPVSLRLYLCH